MSMSDPRVQKPRLPKSYTDDQLAFLRSQLPEFERKSQGSIRGDAKKFALDRASDFIVRYGLPEEFVGVDEAESRFREQIYNWFKNTVGRTRRKLEGRPRSGKKAADKASSPADLTWSTNVSSPTIIPYSQAESSSRSPINTPQPPPPIIAPVQYGGLQPSSSISSAITPTATQHAHSTINLNITKTTLCEGFRQPLDTTTLASMIQSYVLANPSQTPLTPVVDALFDAISADNGSFSRDPHPYLRRFLDASAYFPPSLVHANVAGPLAGPRALQMQIRRYSTWSPGSLTRTSLRTTQSPATSATSMTDEMQRIASDRQRRKDHIQWARIHAAALELGMMWVGHTSGADTTGYSYAMGRAFSEMLARDAVWETDEVEWVAGICILRAVIRTAMSGDRRQRDEYDELLRTYEGRWKEIKDEARQALVTEVLLAAKNDLARLNESI